MPEVMDVQFTPAALLWHSMACGTGNTLAAEASSRDARAPGSCSFAILTASSTRSAVNLIRQLFEAMGMEVHVTQSFRDEGIDAVAYNKTDNCAPGGDPDPGQALQQVRPHLRRPRSCRVSGRKTSDSRSAGHHCTG